MKHTPGPWKYFATHPMSGSAWFVVTDHNGRGPIMDVGGHDHNGQIAEAKYLITDPQEIEANARIITAAPEMLKALEKAKTNIEQLANMVNHLAGQRKVRVEDFTEEVFAAIMKATGQS